MDGKSGERIVDSLVSVIRAFNTAQEQEGNPVFRVLPLDPGYSVLILLMREDLPMSELGRRLVRSKPNMTAIIRGMIREGLVRRMGDPRDRRVVRITITPEGRKRLIGRKKAMGESIARKLGRLGQQDVESLCESLENVDRIAAKLGRD